MQVLAVSSTVSHSHELLCFSFVTHSLQLQFPHLYYTNFLSPPNYFFCDRSVLEKICKSYTGRCQPKLNSQETLQCKSFKSFNLNRKVFVDLTDGHGLSYWEELRILCHTEFRIKNDRLDADAYLPGGHLLTQTPSLSTPRHT